MNSLERIYIKARNHYEYVEADKLEFDTSGANTDVDSAYDEGYLNGMMYVMRLVQVEMDEEV
jgi:hypothetical protein